MRSTQSHRNITCHSPKLLRIGGVSCYLILTTHSATEVPKIQDASLLVAAGQDILKAVSKQWQ